MGDVASLVLTGSAILIGVGVFVSICCASFFQPLASAKPGQGSIPTEPCPKPPRQTTGPLRPPSTL